MKHHLLFALVAGILLIACGSAEDDLEGSWTLDPADIEKQLGEMPEAQREFAKKMFAKMKFTFKDGRITAPDGSSHGYKVVESDGNDLTLEATDGKDKGDRIKVTVDGDTLTMKTKGETMRFLRAE